MNDTTTIDLSDSSAINWPCFDKPLQESLEVWVTISGGAKPEVNGCHLGRMVDSATVRLYGWGYGPPTLPKWLGRLLDWLDVRLPLPEPWWVRLDSAALVRQGGART